jgi:hypothetical protein
LGTPLHPGGNRYNKALMLAESNNHGHAFLLEASHCGYREQWRNPQGKPWVTTLQSKLDAFDTLRESLQVVKVMDRVTWMELRSLTIPPGKVAPEAPKGGHDDSAMAMALGFRCPPRYSVLVAHSCATIGPYSHR